MSGISWDDNIGRIVNKLPLGSTLASNPKFSLADYIELEVENQKTTMECWAFSTFTSMESNLMYKQNIKKDFSERHMDYSTSASFSDKSENELNYTREVKKGSIPEVGLAYLTNGQGAVLENEMPFEDNCSNISYDKIDIKPSYYATEYIQLPSIYKTCNSDGSVNYFDAYENKYTIQEVNNIRNQIKNYIVNNGAVVAVMASNYINGYNNQDIPYKSTAFCCKDETFQRDHAITIIGWDDNYSKNNFNESSRPSTDGAYLIMQSYGSDVFDNGYMYISYEDLLIETSLYGISNSKQIDYDNLYQNDYYGANGTLFLKDCETGYMATTFKRDNSKNEILKKVSFNLAESASVEIYINPNGNDVSKNSLIKVSNKTEVLKPGYHSIDIIPTKLNSDTFVVAVKQKSESGDFYFNIEFKADKTYYSKATSEYGRNFISVDGEDWNILNDLSQDDLINTADLCIKAFTVENEFDEPENPKNDNNNDDNKETVLKTSQYIISSNYIKKIECNTTIDQFFKNVDIIANKIEIYDNNEKIDFDKNTNVKLKTGMKLILDDKEYYFVLKGDISGDGRISLLDISKLLSHYGEIKGYELSGANKEAGDINLDGKVSLIDVSKLLVIYSEM